MDIVEWMQEADRLATAWTRSMQTAPGRGGARFDEETVSAALVDLFDKRGPDDQLFKPENRGALYNYILYQVSYSKDLSDHSACFSDITRTSGDEAGDAVDIDDLLGAADEHEDEDKEENVLLGEALEELSLIRDDALSGSLARLFEKKERASRNIAAEVRVEKLRSLIQRAASSAGVSMTRVREMAKRIIEADGEAARYVAAALGLNTNAVETAKKKKAVA